MEFRVGKKKFSSLGQAITRSKNVKSDKTTIELPSGNIECDLSSCFSSNVSGTTGSCLTFVKQGEFNLTGNRTKIRFENITFVLSFTVLVCVKDVEVEFVNCRFNREEGDCSLTLLSNGTFTDCLFQDIPVQVIGEVKGDFRKCQFKSSIDLTEQLLPGCKSSSGDLSFTDCVFEGLSKGILAVSSKALPVEVTVKKCQFTSKGEADFHIKVGLENDEDIVIVGDNLFGQKLALEFTSCSTLSVIESKLVGAKIGVNARGTVSSISEVQIINATEQALCFHKSYAIVTKVKALNKTKNNVIGISIDGPASSKIKESLVLGMDVGVLLSCQREKPTKHVVENVTFIQNNTAIAIDNAQTDLGGCLFVQSKEYSMRVNVNEKDLKALRVNRDPLLKFWYNNFIEKLPGTKLIDNEWVLNHVRDPHPFKSTTEGEALLYVPDLYERLVRGYVDLEFKKNRARMGDVGVKSVVLVKKLVKDISDPLLEALLKNPRLGAFLVRRKINGAPLFQPETLFESWHDLVNLKLFLDVFDALVELRALRVIESEQYLKQLQVMRDLFLKVVLQSSHARTLEFLNTLSSQRPFETLWFTSQFTRQGLYKQFNNSDTLYAENQKVKLKVLTGMLSLGEANPFDVEIDVTWVKHFALQQLIEETNFTSLPFNQVPLSIRQYWVEALMQENNAKKITKLNSISGNAEADDITKAANMIIRGDISLRNGELRGVIERQSLNIGPTAQIPIFIRRLMEMHGSLGSAFKLYALLNVHLSTRDEFGLKIIWEFLIAQRKYQTRSNCLKMFEDGHCSRCGNFTHASNLLQAKYCTDPSHIFCRRCFKLQLETNFEHLLGVCPGKSCNILCTNSDFCLAEVSEKYREKALDYRLKEYKASLKVWYKCVIQDCKGGSNVLEKRMFTCELCGMFGNVNKYGEVEVSLRLPKDFRTVWLVCVLFRQAVEGSIHIEHYFPFGYAPRYLLTNRGKPNKMALGRITEEIPYDPTSLGKVKNPVAVGLMNYIMTTCPTTVRLLPCAPKIISKMKNKTQDFMYVNYNYNNNRTQANVKPNREDFWLQIQSDQEKEIKFQQAKKKYGSYWAWHGSGIYNWHSILRVGLKNMSNTKYMSAGAAYGAGIYHSPAFQVAAGYSQNRYQAANANKSVMQMFGIAVVECVNKDVKKSNQIYVAQKEDYIQIRFVNVAIFDPNKSK